MAAIFRKPPAILIVEMAPPWAGWEGSTTGQMMINLRNGTSCRSATKEGAAAYTNGEGTAKCDARNPSALRKLIAGGTELQAFSQSIVEASLKASNQVNAATTVVNPDFKKVLESMQAFGKE